MPPIRALPRTGSPGLHRAILAGYYILALCGFWFLWANIMTTATSLRFEKPKITFIWFATFPLGSLLGLAYIVWTLVYFDAIYGP